jgi:Fatty acid desaturase
MQNRDMLLKLMYLINALRFSSMNILYGITIYLILSGSELYEWLSLLFIALIVVFIDQFITNKFFTLPFPPTWYLNAQLYFTYPLIIALNFIILNIFRDWLLRSNCCLFFSDQSCLSYEVKDYGFHNILCFLFLLGFAASSAINIAHELIHRQNSFYERLLGKLYLGFSLSSGWEIEHIYGHHKNVATTLDPITPIRGESIYRYIPRSIIGSLKVGYSCGKNRGLENKNNYTLLNNKFIIAQVFNLVMISVYVYFMGIITGLFSCFFVALIARSLHQITNYIEHYGLIRIPQRPVEARHSWDSYNALESGFLLNLPLHSSHHLFATKPFYDLEPLSGEAPLLPYSYFILLFIVLIPPLWFKIIEKHLADWDARLASDEELRYLNTAYKTLVDDL